VAHKIDFVYLRFDQLRRHSFTTIVITVDLAAQW